MNTRDFLETLENDRIVAAIGEAERKTSGEIRVYVSRRNISDPLARARVRFEKLGMHKTKLRNGVLVYIAPRNRSFAIVGDSGIHEKCGDGFWEQVSAELSEDLKTNSPTEALVRVIGKIGALLQETFPYERGDKNELPDRVERGQ